MRKKPVNPITRSIVPSSTGNIGTDAALWQLADVLAEIAGNDPSKEPAAGASTGLPSAVSSGPDVASKPELCDGEPRKTENHQLDSEA